ncbi:MAG: signal peptidase I [Candidatus Pacearchaeota archaeon]|nr:signal peptidase I [Candidatus Pacearchaeota archaeon]
MGIKESWKKIWKFLWHDDSLASWVVSLILAFIIVKFIFFPLLSLVFGTSLPLVIVESESMHHPGFLGNVIGTAGYFNQWWRDKGNWYEGEGINKTQVESWGLKNGLEMGDIIIAKRKGNLKIGDVIIFNADQTHPIIHRIINIKKKEDGIYYSTKGDNNSGQLNVEKEIHESQIIGKAIFRIPKLGWIKLGFVKLFQAF